MEEELRNYLNNARNSERYFTVKDYLEFIERELGGENYHPSMVGLDARKGMGLFASSICYERDLPVGSETIRNGKRINTYPEKVLAEIHFSLTFPDIFPDANNELEHRYPRPRRL